MGETMTPLEERIYTRLQDMGTAYHALQDQFREEHRIALELEAKLQFMTQRCKTLEDRAEAAEGYLEGQGHIIA